MEKKYTIPFKSLAGKTCRIDIYDKTYSGTTVTTLTGAAPPVSIDEDDDENLLTVLRSKTGYINVVEETFGALAGLYPEDNTRLSVEIYYDNELVFFGYIQAQSFDNTYEDAPRVLSIPIMSPLVLMEGQYFPNDDNNSDAMIGEYLDTCLSVYEQIIIPRSLVSEYSSGVETPLQLLVNNRSVCPYNKDYNYGLDIDGIEPNPYDPISYLQFLEGFCNLYGLIAHEYGKTVVFQKVDYSGQYVKMNVGELQEPTMNTSGMPTGATILNFENTFSPASDKNKEGSVLPIDRLTYEFGDFTDNLPMDLSRSKYVGRLALQTFDFEGVILDPQTNEFHSDYFTTLGGELPNTNHVRVLGEGSRECIEVRVVVPAGSSNDVVLFAYNFSDVPANISGATFETTFTHETGQQAHTMRMRVLSGGKYYDTNHEWVSSEAEAQLEGGTTYLPLTFDEDGKCTSYDVASNGRYVQIQILPPAGSGSSVHGIFYGITLEAFVDKLMKYTYPRATRLVIKNQNQSFTSASIDMLMHTLSGNNRQLSGGLVSRNIYPYLFKSQLRHKRIVKKSVATDMALAYLKQVTSSTATGTWRIIAVSFNPWDDEYEITMHRIIL